MIKYAVVEIKGRQYKVEPNKQILVQFLGENSPYVCEKVLIKADDDKIEYGNPYLKESLTFDILGTQKGKVRVAKFHAKANYRKVRGEKQKNSLIKLAQKREK